MNETAGSRDISSHPATATSFLRWFPWEKLTIWGLFLLAVYILRDFFFIIFMTFIVSYIMRGVIVRVVRLVSARGEVPWLERVLAVVCFALLLLGLYGSGKYLGPPLKQQYIGLRDELTHIDLAREFERLGARTAGYVLFERKYSGREDEQYEKDFQEFRQDPRWATAFDMFGQERRQIQGGFKDLFEEKKKQEIRKEIDAETQALADSFKGWFLSQSGPAQATFEKHREEEVSNWETRARLFYSEEELRQKKESDGYEEWRDEKILEGILQRVLDDPRQLVEAEKDWSAWLEQKKAALEEKRFQEYAASEQYALDYREQFRKHFDSQVAAWPPASPFPYSFERYLELDEAWKQGKEAFSAALGDDAAADEEQLHHDFALTKQEELFREWWNDPDRSSLSRQLRESFSKYADEWVSKLGVWFGDAVKYLLTLPIQLGLSLMLSLFITFDIPKLRKGVRRLRKSRVADFYAEIAPGLYNFGHLMGRAFQAQGVIALVDTILTFFALRLLGITNEVFLLIIVFLCSFIPVIGVVISIIPIAIVAIIQPGGSLWLAIYGSVAVLVIHFIETSILNPKILGDMLHLHPVLVLAVLAVGQHFFGMWGLVLGVPVAVYIIRFVILDEGIPGFIDRDAARARFGLDPGDAPDAGPASPAFASASAGDGGTDSSTSAAKKASVRSAPTTTR
ncbi:MAG: AI-2E family transporter [Planctomycetes bacterium]|nr:AI-2E family transporter [Planctomycetota bacterium]